MRPVRAAIAGAALFALILPGSVQAGSLTRETDTRVGLACDGLTSGNTEVFLFTETSDLFGTSTETAIWTGSTAGPPDLVAGSTTVVLTRTGGSGSIALVELESGDAAGTATLSASFTTSGPAEPYEFTERDGNSTIRVEGVFQPLSVAGTLTVDTGPGRDTIYDLASCAAWVDTFSFTSSNPSTFVSSDQQVAISCSWQLNGGFVDLFALSDRFGAFSDVTIVDGRNEYLSFTDAVLTPTSFAAGYTLFDTRSGEVAGSASASATLTQTDERIEIRDRDGSFKFSASGWVLAVNGTLTIDAGRTTETLVMDEASCSARDVRVHEIIGKTTGPRLRNDAPSGATALAIGSSVAVKTGGTAVEPEATCTVDFGGTVEPLPLNHTAWWTFTGTGGDVTVDTTGSNFDTIVGIYVLDGSTFRQVGCVDDVFDPETEEGSLQARITVPTVAGQTYYVQVGGFGGSAGDLILSVE